MVELLIGTEAKLDIQTNKQKNKKKEWKMILYERIKTLALCRYKNN